MAKLKGISAIEVLAIESVNLDSLCYRGDAPLSHLALISQPDVYDQVTNPEGLQRDLSPKHASDAYEYARRDPDKQRPRAFPEVVLNVRDRKAVQIEYVSPEPMVGPKTARGGRLVRLRFVLDQMTGGKVYVSRVDGNHRLFYAAGDDRRDPLHITAPFQIHVGLSREQERSLFVDINSNQKGLNTSHLSVMQGKLTAEEQEIRDHLDRWIGKKLTDDPASPWHGMIHLGGAKKGSRQQGLTRPVNFVSLQTGVFKTLSKSQYIHDLTDANAQYVVIRNFWNAVKQVFAEEWARPKQFLLLKNIGVTSLSIFAGTVIDRCLARGRVDIEDMANYLRQVRNRFDWNKDATGDSKITGMSGNKAALIIAAELASEIDDTSGETAMKTVQQKLLAQIAATRI